MTFIWPFMLFSLLIVPVIVFAYSRLQRRRSLAASSAGLVGARPASRGSAERQSPGFRRHLPPLLFLAGLVILLIALARPQAPIRLPRFEGTVMLVMDVSASMGAADAEPSRLEAAKAAAREFVLSQPETMQIGIVSFSGSGFTVQPPTNDTNTLLNAIARLEPTSGTSLGQGIVSALHTIAVDAGLVTDEMPSGGDAIPTPRAGETERPSPMRDEAALAQLPEGTYPASIIVLLSDGENNQSIEPALAAQAAAERGVRVDALGFGTTAGAVLEIDGFSVHTALDEATLKQIAETAGGTYYPTEDAQDLEQVYASLTPQLVVKPETMELTSVLAGASIVMLLTGSLFSMLWFNRLP